MLKYILTTISSINNSIIASKYASGGYHEEARKLMLESK